jgi:hypothetical protein
VARTLRHHKLVAGRDTRRQGLAQAERSLTGAGEAVVDIDALGFDAERLKGVALGQAPSWASVETRA